MNRTTTNKIISVNNDTGEVIGYSSKGTLADAMSISRETIVNWFRHSKIVQVNRYTLYKLDSYITKIHPPRKHTIITSKLK